MISHRFGRGRFIAFCVAILIVSANVIPNAAAQNTSEITETGDSGTDRTPRLAMAGDILMVAWLVFDDYGTDILYKVRNQGTWSAIDKLVESTGNERDVALCSSGGRIYAAWATDSSQYTDGTDWDIALSAYDQVNGWSAPVELTAANDTANDYAPVLLPYQNGVIVLWQSFGGDEGHILMSKFTGTALEPVTVTDGWKGMSQNPTAAFLGGTLWIAWSSNDNRYTNGTDLDIVAAPFHIQNETLGDVVQLSAPTDTEDDLYPSMLVIGERLYIAWQSKDKTLGPGDDEDIGLAVYDGEWSTLALTSPHDTGDDTYPHLYAFGDELWIAWQSSDPAITGADDWDIVTAKITDNVLGSVIVVSEGKEHIDEGGTVVRGHDALQVGEDIVVVWETANPGITDGTDRDIAMAILTGTGQEKEDGADGGTGMILILIIIGCLGGLAAFVLLKKRNKGGNNVEEIPKKRKQTRK